MSSKHIKATVAILSMTTFFSGCGAAVGQETDTIRSHNASAQELQKNQQTTITGDSAAEQRRITFTRVRTPQEVEMAARLKETHIQDQQRNQKQPLKNARVPLTHTQDRKDTIKPEQQIARPTPRFVKPPLETIPEPDQPIKKPIKTVTDVTKPVTPFVKPPLETIPEPDQPIKKPIKTVTDVKKPVAPFVKPPLETIPEPDQPIKKPIKTVTDVKKPVTPFVKPPLETIPEPEPDTISQAPLLGSVLLGWDKDFAFSTGEILHISDIDGFEIAYGRDPNELIETIAVEDPTATQFRIPNLVPGELYFAVRVITKSGVISPYSNQVFAAVQ